LLSISMTVRPPAKHVNEGPLTASAVRKRPVRNPEEFRAPVGVRKSWKPEPAGLNRCAMGFSGSARAKPRGATVGARDVVDADGPDPSGEVAFRR